jgi:hypothetical protein
MKKNSKRENGKDKELRREGKDRNLFKEVLLEQVSLVRDQSFLNTNVWFTILACKGSSRSERYITIKSFQFEFEEFSKITFKMGAK